MAIERSLGRAALTVALFLVAGVAAFWPDTQGLAQDASRTLTILAARCPADYVGRAAADECDHAPMPGVLFRAGRPNTDFFLTAPTDASGLVSFDITGLPYLGTIRVIEEEPPQTARIVVYCVDEAGTPLPVTYVPMHGNVPPVMVADIAVGESGDIACDWYHAALH